MPANGIYVSDFKVVTSFKKIIVSYNYNNDNNNN